MKAKLHYLRFLLTVYLLFCMSRITAKYFPVVLPGFWMRLVSIVLYHGLTSHNMISTIGAVTGLQRMSCPSHQRRLAARIGALSAQRSHGRGQRSHRFQVQPPRILRREVRTAVHDRRIFLSAAGSVCSNPETIRTVVTNISYRSNEIMRKIFYFRIFAGRKPVFLNKTGGIL